MKNYRFSTALSNNKHTHRFPSPAKLNLFLYINGRRNDGYHELQTLFQFLDFGDWLTITPTVDSSITLTSRFPALNNEQNLIYRAAKLLKNVTGCTQGADIILDKILPVGGGLGGGSSNAATTLIALNSLWNTALSLSELAELGLTLGADVPVFIHGRSAFAEGVGEKFRFCNLPEKYYVVVKPPVSVATGDIFNDTDLIRNTPKKPLSQLLLQSYHNDCQSVVLKRYPEIRAVWDWLEKYALPRLTGTGACIFAEFDDEISAKSVFNAKPENLFGFVAKAVNFSPLHQMMENLT